LKAVVARDTAGTGEGNMKRNRKVRRFASLAAALAVLLAVSACGGSAGGGDGGGGDLLQEVKDRSVLRVSTDPAYPPQSFQNEQGEYVVGDPLF
jgi:hypothetical protein